MISIRVASIGVLIAIAVAVALVMALTTGAAAHYAPVRDEAVQCCG